MFLFKIGKEKQKHNLTLKLHKITYSDASKLQNGWYFRIRVIRGNHQHDFTTAPIKKGEIKCSKQTFAIPMTLYYDQQAKKFLEKQIEIQGDLMNDLDESQRQLGKSILNITQYMSNVGSDKFVLEVQLNDKKQRACVIKFHVTIERSEEDGKEENKSVNTNERYQSSNEISENQDSKMPKKKQLTHNYRFKEITPSETSSQKSVDLHQILPSKKSKRTQNPKFPPPDNYINEVDSMKLRHDLTDMPKLDLEVMSQKKQSLQNTPSRTPPKPRKQQKDKTKLQKHDNQQQQTESPQLMLFMAQKKLKEKQKLLQISKKKIQDQKQIINKLLQEQSKAYVSTEMIKTMNEIQSLKAQLLKANLKIGELQTKNRHYQSTLNENLKTLDTKSKQAAYYKQQLQKTKLVFGKLMQRCYETNDLELMTFIQEELGQI